MPRLSDSMEEGLIVAWLIENGSEVSVGDEIVEIETDKATMTYEADGNGIVQIVAKEGDSLPVGAPIAHLLSPGEEPISGEDAGRSSPPINPAQSDQSTAGDILSPHSPSPLSVVSDPSEKESSDAARAASNSEYHAGNGTRAKASPLARRLAKANAVELGAIVGSGPGGRIVKKDILEATASPSAQAKVTQGDEVTIVEVTRLQATVARRMTESKSSIPHFYLSTEIDMSSCHAARARLKQSVGEGSLVPSFNDMVVKACGLALREFPKANGTYDDGRLLLHSNINIGVAVAARDALVVPVLSNADQLGLTEIAKRTRELAGKVRDGSITPPELSGGTFTISNLGMFGVSDFGAVINPGQAGILAVGAIEEKAVIRDGQVVAAQMMGVTLSCDHRILYGAEGA